MLEVGQFFLVHFRSVVLWERARLRVYDLCATRMVYWYALFSENVSYLWFSRSEMYGILRYDHSALGGRESLCWLWGCFVCSILFSGYAFRRRTSSNMSWCFVVVVCVEYLSFIRFRSLRMKLIFDFLGIAD